MEADLTYEFSNPLWPWTAKNGVSWYFITVPEEISSQINFFSSQAKAAWGSVRVKVLIGESEWQTSVFPDKKSGTYNLPIKADIRKRESLQNKQMIDVKISLDV
jgi:hypothetical protein